MRHSDGHSDAKFPNGQFRVQLRCTTTIPGSTARTTCWNRPKAKFRRLRCPTISREAKNKTNKIIIIIIKSAPYIVIYDVTFYFGSPITAPSYNQTVACIGSLTTKQTRNGCHKVLDCFLLWGCYVFATANWFVLIVFLLFFFCFQQKKAADDSDTGIGICGWILTILCWLLVLVTMPFSFFICFKVRIETF